MRRLTSPPAGDSTDAVERGSEIDAATIASALEWWRDAGVDTLVAEQPRNWLAPPPARAAAAPVAEAPIVAPALPDEAPPAQLDLFRAWLETSDALPFAAPGAPRLCPSGDPASGLMVIADMPAAEDCAAGTLIAGEAGRLFDRMLAAIGRDRASIYLAGLSCLRAPDGRLADAAFDRCAALARHHVGLAAPRALLLLGDRPAKALTGFAMAQGRGRWHEVATTAGPVLALVTLPPAFLLDRPAMKALAWADLQLFVEGLAP